MRESRTYGSGRGACHEMHVPTATPARVHHAARRRGGGMAGRERARQQRNGPVRLGFVPLGSSSNAYDQSLVEAFQKGLRQVGLIEGRDIVLDVVWTSGDPNQAVSEALRRGAELLIPCGSSASVAAQHQTSTIPIVFLSVGDPKAMGLVEVLATSGTQRDGVQRHPCGFERQVGRPRQGVEQAANADRLPLVYGMAGRSKSLPCHRASCPSRWTETSIKRNQQIFQN